MDLYHVPDHLRGVPAMATIENPPQFLMGIGKRIDFIDQ